MPFKKSYHSLHEPVYYLRTYLCFSLLMLDYSESVLSCQDIGPLDQIIFIAFFGNISVPMKYNRWTYKTTIWHWSIKFSLAIF